MPGVKPELAEVFRRYGDAYRRQHDSSLSTAQRRVMTAIVRCRTAALGGHIEQCEACGHQRISYNSCRNRHCPKCQSLARAQWLENRQSELLPTPYFHVVFTLPAAIAAIAHQNKAPVYGILFRAAAETLRIIAADPKHLGAQLGFLAVLHTWGQTLLLIRICIASSLVAGSRPTAPGGSPAGAISSCRSGYSVVSSAASSSMPSRKLLTPTNSPSQAPWQGFATAPSSCANSLAPGKSSGWSTPNRPSPDPSKYWPMSRDTPTASPSPTIVSSALKTA